MDLMDYRRKIIANSPHLMSASGAVATFSDGADLPLESLVVDIEPVQSGTGDPSPTNIRPISGWNGVKVTRCGKNLWKRVSNSYPVSSYGITYSLNADGSIHVQGTASGQSNNYPIASNGMSVYAGTYTMSVKTTDPNIHFIFGGGNGTAGIAYTDMVNGSKKTFTTNGGTTGHNIIRVNSGATVNGDIYIQLEKGSTDTPWEPYNGVNVSIDLGQTVYGGTLNPLTGVLTAYPYYASYNGETLTGRWVSDRDKYVAGTTPTIGAQVVDMSGTGTEIQLTPHQIRSLYGSNTIFADTGNVALEYWAHP